MVSVGDTSMDYFMTTLETSYLFSKLFFLIIIIIIIIIIITFPNASFLPQKRYHPADRNHMRGAVFTPNATCAPSTSYARTTTTSSIRSYRKLARRRSARTTTLFYASMSDANPNASSPSSNGQKSGTSSKRRSAKRRAHNERRKYSTRRARVRLGKLKIPAQMNRLRSL